MIVAEMVHGSKGLDIQYQIRDEVFTQEQGIPESLSHDYEDTTCFHVIVYEDNIPIATGRIINNPNVDQDNMLIGRIAVRKQWRGQGIGDLLVRKLVDYGWEHYKKDIEVHSQLPAVKFYEKIGFVGQGDVYIEAGKEHLTMHLKNGRIKKTCKHC